MARSGFALHCKKGSALRYLEVSVGNGGDVSKRDKPLCQRITSITVCYGLVVKALARGLSAWNLEPQQACLL
ncbi:hypothetical protein BCT53_20270 [Vibrio lentus]|nr:hypothetical protein BCU64_12805 [Vibrio lentus]PMM49972.1 hypothetical protein BCT53_20270 [Vibrio lentus]